jgi:TfoX N-terminal domain
LTLERLRAALAGRDDVVEKRMVSGRSFMVGGRLALGVVGDDLMIRADDAYNDLLARAHVRPMTLGGRPLKHYLLVAPEAFQTDGELQAWIDRATSGSP